MNTTLKRVISLMLCFVLMAGILPVGAMAAEGEETVATESTEATQEATEPAASEEPSEPEGDTAPSEEVTESTEEVTEPAEEEILTYGLTRATDYLDAAIFCSDVHGSSSAVSSAFNGIKNADSTFIPSTATFVGDTQMAASSVTSAAQSVYSAVACYYAYGNHDSEGNYGISDVTGLLYSGDYYYIYAISQSSMASSNPDTSGFTSTVASLDKSKPLFIASHLPLHDRRGDSNGAAAWYEAISAAAEQMDIVFFWAHNHTGENDVDRAAFYVAKDGDETFTLENTSTVVTPNFTYMNAGFVGKSSSRGGVVTTIKIYADSLVFQDYTSSGAFTGEYSHNVTVAREFAATEPEVTLSSIAISGDTEYFVGDKLDLTVTATYSDGTTEDVTSKATISGYDLSAAGTQTVTATYEGKTATTEITVTEVQINSIKITTPAAKLSYITGETLDTTGLVITAVYNNGTEAVVTGWYPDTVDLTTAGEKTVTINYAVDGITYQTSYTVTVEEGVAEDVTLESIAVTDGPTKTEYLISESLSIDGLVVVATFSDGSTKELSYKPFANSTVYGGYELGEYSMYVQKGYEVEVSYTFREVTKTATFSINVWDETFTDEDTGVKVAIAAGDYGVTAVKVAPSSNSHVSTAIAELIEGTVTAYDITLTLDADTDANGDAVYELTNGAKTVTLPIPEGVTNPVVYYVSDDGATVTNMSAQVSGNNVVFTTTHFSTYVVGQAAEIETESGDATVVGGTTTTTKEVWVKVDAPTNGGEYLIVSTGTAGTSGYVMGNSAAVTPVSGTLNVNGTDGTYTYIETTGTVWTASGSGSSWSFENPDGTYLGYTTSSSYGATTYTLSATDSNERTWTLSNNNLYFTTTTSFIGTTTYYRYITGGTSWSLNYSRNSAPTSANVYFYQKVTVSETTGTIGHVYSTVGTDITDAVALSGNTVTLTSVLYDTPEGGTKTDITASSGLTPTYEVVTTKGNPAVVSSIEGSTLTLSGVAGTAVVKVTYTSGDLVAWDEFTVTASTPVLQSITVGGKEEYVLGESFAPTVTATYTVNGTTMTKVLSASDYTVSGVDMTVEGQQTATVTYTYNGVTVTDTFTFTVTAEQSNEVTIGSSGVEMTVYVLTDSLTAGGEYLIVNTNAAGSGYALLNNSGSVSSVAVTIVDSDAGKYIELDNSGAVWTAVTNSSGYNLTNTLNGTTYYIEATGSTSAISIDTSDDNSSRYWNYSSDDLGYYGGNSTHYIYYDSGFVSAKNSGSEAVYIYEKQTINTSTSVTYTMRAEDLEKVVDSTNNATLSGQIDFCLQGNGKDLTSLPEGGSYSFTVLSDTADIIKDNAIASDGTFTFTGNEGTAKVQVAYTWTQDGQEYTVFKNATVTATSPYYTINLHKANITYTEATGITEFAEGVTYFTLNADGTYSKIASDAAFDSTVTYYTVSATVGDDITAPVAVKGVEQGDTYYVWAVIKKFDGTSEDGTDLGDVADNRIYWTSSNTNVATVDATTGEITFTGNDGTVTITAYYLDENGDILCEDAIVISATKELYTVPEDGTNDFPEYPNEGAVRFDKNATAVGNFSETGITKVELSMTGVPYSTGSEIDVVLMLDMTGSMTDDSMAAAEAAALAFAKQIILNEDGSYNDNRISIQVFNKNGVTELWAMSAVTKDTYSSLVTAIESASDNQASGGTPYSTALSGCKDILDAARADSIGKDRQQFCVFVSDGTPTSYTDVDGGSDTTKKEYYSSQMQEDGVTVYGVYTSAGAGSTGSGGGSVNDTAEGTAIMQNVASSDDKVYVIEDYTDTSALNNAFTTIAKEIREAAKDVVVADQITPEYTMIFDIPKGDVDISGKIPSGQEFYIEVMDYAMTPVYATDGTTITDYQRGTGTSKIKLYLGVSNGTYYAASDANGTAFATPAFNTTAIGTMFYWTTDVNTASGVSVTVDSTTYYFVAEGISNTDDSFDAAKWFNMASGAYASGTVNSETNTSTDLIIATPYFVYNASTKMLTWTAEKLSSNELVLSYFLYLDNSATEVGKADEVDPDSYPTNVEASITYTNYNGVRCQDEFPVPQMTWKGAQVSFVFYLVNEAGQPVNRAGKVVPFSEAVYVTDVHMESMTWNDATASEQFDATQLAADILPDVFQLYDSEAYFEIHVYEVNDDYADYFIIDGSTGVANQKTTKVFNTKADYEHRYSAFGAYSNTSGTYTSTDPDHLGKTYTTTVTTGFDYANTTVAFAVVWKPELVPDTVVVDYGLDVVIDVTTNDAMASGVVGVRVDQPDADINNGTYDAAKAKSVDLYIDVDNDEAGIKELLIGKATVDSLTSVRFSLDKTNGMQFTEPVTFYYESDVNYYVEGVLTTASMYSSVTVIPATTIYYEDEYVTLTTYNANNAETDADGNLVVDSSTTYDATPGWDTSSVAAVATQAVDRPGVGKVSAAYDADNNYGYDKAYTDLSTYSMGSAAMTHVQSGKYATATFSFYGTGFDVISMTSNLTGTITVKVEGPTSKNLIVDTYYGYAQDADGNWVQTDNDPNALYQVPVIKVEGLEYGKYTVTITATYSKYFDHTSPAGYDLYLDAIRIYDPTGNLNDTANNAYVADGEGWPSYTELRNNIISAEGVTTATDAEGNITVSFPDDVTLQKGAVFIDSNDDANSIADYVSYGPNNELYLDNGQAVAFNVDTTNVADVQLGIKMANGDPVTYKINDVSYTVDTAADMYYSILDQAKAGTVIIENVSGGILSLTNIKVTFESDPNGVDAANVLSIDEESAGFALMSLRRAPVVETEPTEPEVTEPETEATEPEDTAPETEATEPETTAPETEATEPETTEPETEATEPEVTEPETEPTEPGEDSGAEDTIVEVIGKIIKKLFGWLFG